MVSEFELFGSSLYIYVTLMYLLGHLQILSYPDHLLLHFMEHIGSDNDHANWSIQMYKDSSLPSI